MRKRMLALVLAAVTVLSGCSGVGKRQPDESALPALEYTRPESETLGSPPGKGIRSQGRLSDGSDYILYDNNELEIVSEELTTSLKTEKALADSLKDITVLTLNVEIVGAGACSDLNLIQKVTLGSQIRVIGASAFSKCTALPIIQFPDGLEEIGDYAFQGCSSLWRADIPCGVTSMGRQLFVDCGALHSISIDSDVGEASFAECTALRDITFGENCTNIGKEGFSGCTGIMNLRLGNSVSRIEDQAFSGCQNITYVYFPAALSYIGQLAFTNVQKVNILECESLKEYYKMKHADNYARDTNLFWLKPKEIKK